MSYNLNDKPLLVVIYPYKFTDFVYHKLELGYFSKSCDVYIWDISHIATPAFANAVITERSSLKEVIVLYRMRDFIRKVSELKKKSRYTKAFIITEVYNNSLREFLCNLILKILLNRRSISVIEYCNGGVPLNYPSLKNKAGEFEKAGFLAKSYNFIKRATSIKEVLKTVVSVFFQRLGNHFASITTHKLVAGEDYLNISKESFRGKKGISLVYGHSEDFSNFILQRNKVNDFIPPYPKIATYIDGPGPMFTGDVAYFGRKVHFTSEVWYPSLCHFFDEIESKTGVKVIIAGHYKTKHPHIAPCFANRLVYYGKVKELVLNSEFVITRASTAISYAVIFKKPVISIFSNQLKNDQSMMFDINGMAAVLGNTPINIDDAVTDLDSLLKIKEDRYKYYEKVCLSSNSSSRPNCQIIMEEIMDIKVQIDYINLNDTI
jgi:hypothetical protein